MTELTANQLRAELKAKADIWVPQMYPSGRLNKRNGEYRVGDIDGRKGTSLSIQLTGAKAGQWHDFTTGTKGGALDLICHAYGLTLKQAIEMAHDIVGVVILEPQATWKAEVNPEATAADKMAYINQVIAASHPVAESQTDHYLRGRGITYQAQCGDTLRHMLQLNHGPTQQRFPCMIAKVHDCVGNLMGLHRTYLNPSQLPQKADVDPAKLMLGSLRGGAVRLGKPVNGVLGVAEGIESAFSAWQLYGIPTWATMATAFMEAFEIPMDIEISKLVIFADNDKPGIKSAYALKEKAEAAGLQAQVALPVTDDFNDMLMDTLK